MQNPKLELASNFLALKNILIESSYLIIADILLTDRILKAQLSIVSIDCMYRICKYLCTGAGKISYKQTRWPYKNLSKNEIGIEVFEEYLNIYFNKSLVNSVGFTFYLS